MAHTTISLRGTVCPQAGVERTPAAAVDSDTNDPKGAIHRLTNLTQLRAVSSVTAAGVEQCRARVSQGTCHYRGCPRRQGNHRSISTCRC